MAAKTDTAPTLAELQRTATEFEERVRNGDRSVTPAQVSQALEAVRYCELVDEADRRAEAVRVEAERSARYRALIAELVAVEAEQPRVVTAMAAVRAAATALFELSSKHQERIAAALAELRTLGDPPDGLDVDIRTGTGGRPYPADYPQAMSGSQVFAIFEGRTLAMTDESRPGRLVFAAIGAALPPDPAEFARQAAGVWNNATGKLNDPFPQVQSEAKPATP